MNNAVTHSGFPSQTKNHKTISQRCMLMSCSTFSFYFRWYTLQTYWALVHSHLFTFLSCFSNLNVQACRPSRPSGLSPGTSLCKWEPQLCWGVRCCGPQGLCSGWKTASSWDLREVCQAFHATAWLETPREVHRHVIRYKVYWTLMSLSKLNKQTWKKKASLERCSSSSSKQSRG